MSSLTILNQYCNTLLNTILLHSGKIKQFKQSIKSFPTNTIVSIVDFAKNYTLEVQNKVQNMHYHSYQIFILMHINFHHNPTSDPYDEDFKILT